MYKKVIDKQKLQEFCMGLPIDDSHVEALNLLANVVLVKHFPTLSIHFKDLRQYMYLKACEIRYTHNFNDDQSAYSYLYTVFYRDVQNKIWRFSKEPNFDDILSSIISAESAKGNSEFSDVVVSQKEIVDTDISFDSFKEISEFIPFLCGDSKFVKKRIPEKDVLNVLLFLRLHEKKLLSHVELPSFVGDAADCDTAKALFKLCSDLISLVGDDGEGDDTDINVDSKD